MIDPVRRKELIAAATELFRADKKNWKPVLDQFPDIPRATAYRIINAVVHQHRGKTPPNGQSAEEIQTLPEPGSWRVKGSYVPLKTPIKPQPDDKLPMPEQIVKLRELYQDAVALKEQSLDKHGKIKNVATFQKSIDLRMKLAVADANLFFALAESDRKEVVLNSIANIAWQYDPEIGLRLMRDVGHYYISTLRKDGKD